MSDSVDILSMLLDTDLIPEKKVYMKRFGVNFVVKAIDAKTMARIKQQAAVDKSGSVDREKLNALIVVNGSVNPKWSDPALLDKFGPTPADVVQNRLLAGEIVKLVDAILDLSGFGDSEADKIEEVKN